MCESKKDECCDLVLKCVRRAPKPSAAEEHLPESRERAEVTQCAQHALSWSERQSLAMMHHPAIAKVFDAGTTPQGQPYLVMEYVPGLPITEYCDHHANPTFATGWNL
jgi:serine/threonine protein kinase